MPDQLLRHLAMRDHLLQQPVLRDQFFATTRKESVIAASLLAVAAGLALATLALATRGAVTCVVVMLVHAAALPKAVVKSLEVRTAPTFSATAAHGAHYFLLLVLVVSTPGTARSLARVS